MFHSQRWLAKANNAKRGTWLPNNVFKPGSVGCVGQDATGLFVSPLLVPVLYNMEFLLSPLTLDETSTYKTGKTERHHVYIRLPEISTVSGVLAVSITSIPSF